MPTTEESLAIIEELKGKIAIQEQLVAEDPKRVATLVAVQAAIDADPLLISLGATAIISDVHPEWCNIDFPLAAASGERALAIRYILLTAKGAGATVGIESTAEAKIRSDAMIQAAIDADALDPDPDFVPPEPAEAIQKKRNRIYFPVTRLVEAIELFRREAMTEADRQDYDLGKAEEESA